MVRKLLIALAVLLALLVVAALAVMLLVDPDDYRDELAQRASDQLGREVRLDGPMSLRLFPWLAIEISDVAVGNPPDFGTAPALARIGTATAAVRLLPLLRGEIEVGRVSLADAEIHLVSDRAGRSNLDGLLADEAATAPGQPPDLSRLSLGELHFSEVRLVQLDLASGQRQALWIESLNLDPFRAAQPVPFRLRGRVEQGEETVLNLRELTGRIELAIDLSRVALTQLVGEFRLADGSSGSLRAGVEADLSGTHPLLRLPVLDLSLAIDRHRVGLLAEQPLVLRLSEPARLDLPAARIHLNEQALAASGHLLLGEPITAELALRGQRLDLRPFMAEQAPPRGSPAEPSEPDFSALLEPRLNLALLLDELILSDQLSLAQVEARAQLRGGLLTLQPLTADLFGGRFEGRVSVDFNQQPPLVQLQPALRGILVDQLAALSGRPAPLSGQAELDLDLSFSGLDLDSILASLDGSGRFSIDDGALQGVDLRQLIDGELSRSNFSSISRSFGGQTEFQSIGGSLAARSGVIELPDLALVAGDYGLSGRGRLDLPAGAVDYRLQMRLGESLRARLPRQLVEATGGDIPLSITGPMAQPVVSIDLGNLVERALRQQIEQRLLPPRRDTPDVEAGDDDEAASAAAQPTPPDRRERGRDLLMRTLQERSRQEPPPQAPEEEQAEEEEPPPGASGGWAD